MDNFEMAIALIRRAQNESKRLAEFKKAIDVVYAQPNYNWKLRMEIESQFSPTPRKSVVNDSLKMARQFLKEEYV